MTTTNKIQSLAQVIEKQTITRYTEDGMTFDFSHLTKVTVKPGRKYTKIDVGGSGKYMVDNSTGDIFGIKAYGQIHVGHYFGNLDTTEQYNWGHHTATKKIIHN